MAFNKGKIKLHIEERARELGRDISDYFEDHSPHSIQYIPGVQDSWVALAKQLIDGADVTVLADIPDISDVVWGDFALYWIAYISCWCEDEVLKAFFEYQEVEIADIGDELVITPALQAALHKHAPRMMNDAHQIAMYQYAFDHIVFSLLSILTRGQDAYPWKRAWLMKPGGGDYPWLDGQSDLFSFIASGNKVEGRSSEVALLFEKWCLYHGLYAALAQESLSEVRAVVSALKNKRVQLSDDSDPSDDELSALEAEQAADDDELLKLLDQLDAKDPALIESLSRSEIADPISQNPLLLEGDIPQTLAELLALYSDESVYSIAELHELFDAENMEPEELRATLVELIPRNLEDRLYFMDNSTDAFFGKIHQSPGRLFDPVDLMAALSHWERAYVAVTETSLGYRVGVTEEIKALLDKHYTLENLHRVGLSKLVYQCTQALVHTRGVVKMEDVLELINREYYEAFKEFDFRGLRRFVRECLERFNVESSSVSVAFERPYLYVNILNIDEWKGIYENIVAHTPIKQMDQQAVQHSQYAPFTANRASWDRFTAVCKPLFESLDWVEEGSFLFDMALLASSDQGLERVTEALKHYNIDIKNVKTLERFLRAWSDYANDAPNWFEGGFSYNEIGKPKTYEQRMEEAIQNDIAREHDHGHHHHGHDHHGHDHDHDHGHHHHH